MLVGHDILATLNCILYDSNKIMTSLTLWRSLIVT